MNAPARARAPAAPPRAPVLVVDDDRAIREVLREILELEGYSVQVASQGAEALEVLAGAPAPGIILVDLMMPVMNGYELIDALRSHPTLASIPVTVMSASSHPDGFYGSGALRKPIELEALLELVGRACGRG